MVPPRWSDEQGRPLPTYPCSRCGREVAVRVRGFRGDNPWQVGWHLFTAAISRDEHYVNWCGHGQEIIRFPLPDGRVILVPVLGEAR